MDGTGDQFLAGTRLAMDQHAGISGSDYIDLLDNFQYWLALSDDFPVVVFDLNLFLQVRILILEALLQLL
ncbi:hypothetical protein D3C78_1848250 [compost metagenome]